MAILVGYALFWLEHILPQIQSRRNVLSISRMLLGWKFDQLIGHFERLGIPYDRQVAARMRK